MQNSKKSGFIRRIYACILGASLILGSQFAFKAFPSAEWNHFVIQAVRKINRVPGPYSKDGIVPEFVFEEIGLKAGLISVHGRNEVARELSHLTPLLSARGASVSVSDFNNDGLMDFYYTSASKHSMNALYRNNGDGTFTDVAQDYGVADLNQNNNSMSALWFDFNNDGWKDLYVVAMGCNRLFKNINGNKFEDVTLKAGDIGGIPDEHGFCGSPRSVLAMDYNLDGLLDVFVSNFNPKDWRKVHNNDTAVMFVSAVFDPHGPQSYLFKNNGNGTFSEVAKEMGVANFHWAQSAGSSDFNNDGWPDLFIANDVGHDRVYLNREGKSFELIKDALPGLFPRFGMNGDIADINDDGLTDIFNTKIAKPGYTAGLNQLWQNMGNGKFLNVAIGAGVSSCGWAWAGRFTDLASRGTKDLVVVNGLASGNKKKSYWYNVMTINSMDSYFMKEAKVWPPMLDYDFSGNEKSCVFYRRDDGKFVDVHEEVGVMDEWDGRGLAIIDGENDGRPDLLVGNVGQRALYYRNDPHHDNNWIGFSLKGTISNKDAIGTRIKLSHKKADGLIQTQYWEVNAGNGYASQSDPRLLFGLGAGAVEVTEVSVIWPGLKEQILDPASLKLREYNRVIETY